MKAVSLARAFNFLVAPGHMLFLNVLSKVAPNSFFEWELKFFISDKNSDLFNCLITDMFTGLEYEKKDKVQVSQQNKMLSLYCTAFGFISKN